MGEWSWLELAAMRNMTDALQYWDGEEEEIGSRTSGSTKVFGAFFMVTCIGRCTWLAGLGVAME